MISAQIFIIQSNSNCDFRIKISGAFGSTLLYPRKEDKQYNFVCPKFISQQSGVIAYTLIANKKVMTTMMLITMIIIMIIIIII